MSKTAEELKELGNQAFGSKDYPTAIKHYSDAIQKDPKNHVFYSNRSASYAALQQNEKASADAKECIRIDPTFVKGYYRLVNSQIGLKEYDAAIATIRQGLAVDADNAQLLKQQRMVLQLKRSQESSTKKRLEQPTDAAVPQGFNSELQELYTQFTNTKREYEMEKVNLQKTEREEKIFDLTRQELLPLPADQKCYRPVGKMFLLSKKEDVLAHLDTTVSDCQKKQTELKSKLSYLEQKLQSQQQNMQEVQKQSTSNE